MSNNTTEVKNAVPLTCHGHSRPVTHISYSNSLGLQGVEDSCYMISACKDNNPMLRDGSTGDWIGTFFNHKGAVYQARLSSNASVAATASADFTARVWDTHTGQETFTLQHNHVVRAVAFPPHVSTVVATGGVEKKLRIFDLGDPTTTPKDLNNPYHLKTLIPSLRCETSLNDLPSAGESVHLPTEAAYEVGPGVHKGTIKSIVWTQQPEYLITAAEDKVIRWWNLSDGTVLQEYNVDGEIGSVEFTNIKSEPGDIGGGALVLTVAAGNKVHFFGGDIGHRHIKTIDLGYAVASVALHPTQRKFVTGGIKDTWAKVHDFDSGAEIDVHKGHHGPIWSISFSPDGKLYATGSEDGTIKMWKNCEGPFGLWGRGV